MSAINLLRHNLFYPVGSWRSRCSRRHDRSPAYWFKLLPRCGDVRDRCPTYSCASRDRRTEVLFAAKAAFGALLIKSGCGPHV